MNLFTAIVQIASNPEMRYTGSTQAAIVSPKLTMMNRYGDHGLFEIESVAWGKVAESIAKLEEGTVVLASGQLDIVQRQNDGGYKENIATFKISEVVMTLPDLAPFNQISIMGNVGQEVDARHFESNKNNAKFSLAVRRTKDETNWFAIETWGKTADTCNSYLTKGSKVAIVGHLKLETWIDKNTEDIRSKPIILGDRISLGGKGAEAVDSNDGNSYDRQNNQNSSVGRESESAMKSDRPSQVEANFDDIPF